MARQQNKKLAAVTTGSAGSSGIPCAMVLTVSFGLSPGTGLSCPRRRAIGLAQLDTSVGVSGPHDFAVRVGIVRPRAQSARATPSRPSQPASRSVTIGHNAPLHRGGMARENHSFLKNGIKIFLRGGLDSRISADTTLNWLIKFDSSGKALWHPTGHEKGAKALDSRDDGRITGCHSETGARPKTPGAIPGPCLKTTN
jgi:hypothetical protein